MRKLHSFVPISNSKVRASYYSASDISREERGITLRTNDLPPESIVGFVTCLCDGKWWLACVFEIIQEDSQVKLTFLHPHGPSNPYKCPGTQDIHTVPIDSILTLVDPRTRTGHVYTLRKKLQLLLKKFRIMIAE